MRQLFVKGGGVVIEETPAPDCGPKSLLVKVGHSCVSVGTEMASVKHSAQSLIQRAVNQPANVKRFVDYAREYGLKRALDKAQGRTSLGIPIGYSAAGTVVAIGAGAEGFAIGDRVACAGAGIANHAEYIDVPVNLAVKIPDAVSLPDAATVALGAIAMQGVRRASASLGETVAVIGLGMLGQLTVAMLKAAGCKVIGSDIDAARIDRAKTAGLDVAVDPASADFAETVHAHTDGVGADAVIITAAAPSHEIVSHAMQACRKKGKTVLVGDVGLNLKREDFYAKELDFLVSTSYGPGRYDPAYELAGNDYPIAYVRWSENRNMAAYLSLMAEGKINLTGMSRIFPVAEAPAAYALLQGTDEKPLVALIAYDGATDEAPVRVVGRTAQKVEGKIGVGIVGAGGFAMGMHIPNLMKLRDRFDVRAVMSRTGAAASAAAKQCEADVATTDYAELLDDPAIDLILIANRHDRHAAMTLAALEAGKHVFVEKPLALVHEEIDAIEAFYADNPDAPALFVGYNRRFAPAILQAQKLLADRATPLMIAYRMNAGFILRIIGFWPKGAQHRGEACHIYHLFSAVVGATSPPSTPVPSPRRGGDGEETITSSPPSPTPTVPSPRSRIPRSGRKSIRKSGWKFSPTAPFFRSTTTKDWRSRAPKGADGRERPTKGI